MAVLCIISLCVQFTLSKSCPPPFVDPASSIAPGIQHVKPLLQHAAAAAADRDSSQCMLYLEHLYLQYLYLGFFLQHPNQSLFTAAEVDDPWSSNLAVLYHTGPHETCSVVDILCCSYASEQAPNPAVSLSHRVRQPALEARCPFLQGAMALDICTMPSYQSGAPPFMLSLVLLDYA